MSNTIISSREKKIKYQHLFFDLDHTFLDHQDIQIDFASGKGAVRNGRVVELRFCIATHLVALAFLA